MSARDIPPLNRALLCRRDRASAVGADRNVAKGAACVQPLQSLTRTRVPNEYRSVFSRGKYPVPAEHRAPHRPGMAFQLDIAACCNRPYAGRSILACGDEPPPVGAERAGNNVVCMFQGSDAVHGL